MAEQIDVLLEASQAHTAELLKQSGTNAALVLMLSAVLTELKIAPASDEQLERLKTSFHFSKLQDREVEAAHKTLRLLLQPPLRLKVQDQ